MSLYSSTTSLILGISHVNHISSSLDFIAVCAFSSQWTMKVFFGGLVNHHARFISWS